jgi:N-acetylneuraminic acid mutarotase
MRALVVVTLLVGFACAPPQPGAPPGEGGEWTTELPPLPLGPRQETGVAVLDGEMYVVGGFDETNGVTPFVEAWDPALGRWREVAELPVALHHANVAATGGKLYVLGFLVGGGFFADPRGFVYDPADDEWTPIAPLPPSTDRGGGATAVIDGDIFVIGGIRGSPSTEVHRYDPDADAYTQVASLPEPRDHLVAGVIDGTIVVVGGREGPIRTHEPSVFLYDPVADAWSEGASMPTSRAGHAGAVLGGKIFVFGGEGADVDSGVFHQNEAYDLASDTWERLAPMPTPRHGLGAAAIDGVIYLAGGGDLIGLEAVDTHESYTP